MKAVTLRKYGPPENLCLEELPDPPRKSDQLLVRVRAAEVTKANYELRACKLVGGELSASFVSLRPVETRMMETPGAAPNSGFVHREELWHGPRAVGEEVKHSGFASANQNAKRVLPLVEVYHAPLHIAPLSFHSSHPNTIVNRSCRMIDVLGRTLTPER